jgi:CheY-like chemotaxis protein
VELTGYTALEAQNGEQAIACSLADRPDIIFMDLGLPDVDGAQAASMIKQNPATSHIPIVAVTAWDTGLWKGKAIKAGIGKYLVKPVSPLIVKETIEELMDQRLQPLDACRV